MLKEQSSNKDKSEQKYTHFVFKIQKNIYFKLFTDNSKIIICNFFLNVQIIEKIHICKYVLSITQVYSYTTFQQDSSNALRHKNKWNSLNFTWFNFCKTKINLLSL